MTKKPLMLIALCITVGMTTSYASLIWVGSDGGGDGVSLFQEANWLDDNGATPAAGTIDPNIAVTALTGGLIEINSGTGTPSAFGNNFRVGVGNAINIGGGKTLASTGAFGMGQDGFSKPLVAANLSGASTVNVQYAVNFAFVLDGGSTLRLRGDGNPLNQSTVDILDMASMLQFSDETLVAFNAEHAGKVTVNGAALNFGTDALIAEAGDNALASAFNGASGIQIQAIPEPATLGMVVLCGGGILFIRRRFKN